MSTKALKLRNTTSSILLHFNMWCFYIKDGINSNMKTIAGEDVSLECLSTKTIDSIIAVKWRRGNGSILFDCNKYGHPCEIDTTRHSLGKKNTFFSSTFTIRNVSLFEEDEYNVVMLSQSSRETCKFNLTVNGIYILKLFWMMTSTSTNIATISFCHVLFKNKF